MSDDTTRRRFLSVAGVATAAGLAGCIGGGDGTETPTEMNEMTDAEMDGTDTETDGTDTEVSGMETMTVRVENVAPTEFYGPDTSTGGQIWLTPGAFAVHTESNPIFTAGEPASIGLEALAEAGPPTGFEGEPGLVDELQDDAGGMNVVSTGAYTPAETVEDPNDPMGDVPGAPPIAPGGAFEFEIESPPGSRLSLASMFVPSNDLFVSPGKQGIALWDDGSPVEGDVTDAIELWDAGTEPNGQPGVDPDQPPTQESAEQGSDEDGVVRPLSEVDDGFEYPDVSAVIRVTVTPG